MDELVIGIDLGTTNNCVAYFKNDCVEILENSEGKRVTPSCVFFKIKSAEKDVFEPVIGQYVKKWRDALPKNGVYEIKRFVGRSFKEVEQSLQYFSFNVIDSDGEPVIAIEQENNTFRQTPQDITALILKQVKKDVENKLGHPITKAVITVPAYFNYRQREVTLAAATQAGFTVLKLFNEPTAAALSYYFKTDDENECYSLVYDLGGGTFDVSLLKRNSTKIDIICVDGDVSLGGKDIDNIIVDYVCDEIKKLYNYDPKTSRRDMRRIQNFCEEAKMELSTIDETDIVLLNVVQGTEITTIALTRKELESKAQSLFKKTINIVENCLKVGNVSKGQIKDVILAGGSSRIPKIQEMLSNFFDEAKITRLCNPDECVAEGAALQAALLSNHPKQQIKQIKVTDVTRLSIGIADFVDRMNVVVPKNSPIPVTKSTIFTTTADNQTYSLFKIFEGQRLNVAHNIHIGTIALENLTPAPPGLCEICITVTINNDGILKIKASEHLNNNVKEISVKYIPGSRNDFEVKNVIQDVKERIEEDKRFAVFASQKEKLINYCEAVCYNLRTLKLQDKYHTIYNKCCETSDNINDITIGGEKSPEEILKEIKTMCEPLVKLHKFISMPQLHSS